MLEKSDLQTIQKLVSGGIQSLLKQEIKPMKADTRAIKADMSKTRRDINMIIEAIDTGYIDLRKRVERIEERVGIV